MPNITFEERQGASIIRRICAGVWILIALAGAIAYVNYAPKTFRGNMDICFKPEAKNVVITQIESLVNESTPDLAIEDISAERLVITCTAPKKNLVLQDLLTLKESINNAVQSRIEAAYNQAQTTYNQQLSTLEQRLKDIKQNSSTTTEFFQLIAEIREAIKNRSLLPAGWEMMFADNPRYRSILQELIENITAIEELNIQLKTEASRMLVLSEWISTPENQVIQITEKRIVQYEDTPELLALKDRLAEIEASRMRLLRRATTKHPLVIKMSAEIDELQAQINALTRRPQVVEDIKEITNPKISEFNSKIILTKGNIAALNSRLDTLSAKTLSRLNDLESLVKDSLKDQDSSRIEALKSKINEVQKIAPQRDEPIIAGYFISPAIQRVDGPNLYLIYALAGFCGLIGAFLIMYSTKKSSFKLEEVEATPEFPVLGKIGRIGGSKITRS